MSVVYDPTNAVNKTVVWSTDNAAVATVNGSGLANCLAVGTANIKATAQDGGFEDSCALSVIIPVTAISVTPATVPLAVAGTQQLTTAFTPANGTNQGLNYSSSDPTKASVSASGLVTGVAPGTATITISTVGNPTVATDTVAVTVT
jgi:uncharacterized protein YjdB